VPNAHVGVDTDINDIRANNDAVVLCTGATWPRNLNIKGRDADGIHFAMDYLQVSNTPLWVLSQRRRRLTGLSRYD
jgi:glutamate synthase (NADPH/NADH)